MRADAAERTEQIRQQMRVLILEMKQIEAALVEMGNPSMKALRKLWADRRESYCRQLETVDAKPKELYAIQARIKELDLLISDRMVYRRRLAQNRKELQDLTKALKRQSQFLSMEARA